MHLQIHGCCTPFPPHDSALASEDLFESAGPFLGGHIINKVNRLVFILTASSGFIFLAQIRANDMKNSCSLAQLLIHTFNNM